MTISKKSLMPSKVIYVHIEYEDAPRKIPGTHAKEEYRGALTVYSGEEVVARFTERVKNWWTEEA
jgi:hypothetical protein